MQKRIPHNYYPRPTLVRDSFLSLNGEWDFSYSEAQPKKYSRKITVPYPPESKLSGINESPKKGEKLYYRRLFSIPTDFNKNRIILHFGAVDQIAEVYLNNRLLGRHEGGYLPFDFDITELLADGENLLSVVVTDELSQKYPYGKQRKKRGGMWYTPISGIWQSVWLESIPHTPIEKIKIISDVNEAKIFVKTESKNLVLKLKGTDEVYESSDGAFVIRPKEKRLWTPQTPYLYHFSIESETDKIESYFALREIGIQKSGEITRLTLNGKPYLFNGLLDQGYFKDGIFLPKTAEEYKNDILGAKKLGFNMLRKHIKIEPEIFYYMCDSEGIVVFQDMVNNSDYSFIRDTAFPTVFTKRIPDKHLHRNKEHRQVFIDTMQKTIVLLHNHPSVLYYTIFNEGWGQFSADEVYKIAKQTDPTRIFDATSGWFWQKESDVDSHHIYFKKLRAKINPDKPCVISEFGGYSYRCEGHLFSSKNYGYKTFKNKEEFENAFIALYEQEALPLVESGISALVYTQLSDVEDETNGIFTYDREVCKIDAKRCKKIMTKLTEISNK